MPTCDNCGEEIEFRHIEGRIVPIHPDGGWHCGFQSNSSSHVSTIPRNYSGVWHDEDFTRPTICQECGESVFFIRHNGGSVWVNSLGTPWPKHPCFDKPATPTRAFSSWSAKTSRFTNPKLAVVIRIYSVPKYTEPVVEIRLQDSRYFALVLKWTTPAQKVLLGSLLAVSVEESKLLLSTGVEIPFFIPDKSILQFANWVQCHRCRGRIIKEYLPRHEEFCRCQRSLKVIRPNSAVLLDEPNNKNDKTQTKAQKEEDIPNDFREDIECKVEAEYETLGEDWVIPASGLMKTNTGSHAWQCASDGQINAMKRVFNKLMERFLQREQQLRDDIDEAIDNFENDPTFENLIILAWKLNRISQ